MKQEITIGFIDKTGKLLDEHSVTIPDTEDFKVIPLLFKTVQCGVNGLDYLEMDELVKQFPLVKNWDIGKLQVLKIEYKHELLLSLVYDTYKTK